MESLSEARIYVGTYAKYNNGSLFGEWLTLSDYSDSDEFMEACLELHSDEDDPELMFQDWENIPSGLITESSLSENIFEIIEALSNLDNGKLEAFEVWLNYTSHDMSKEDIDSLISSFEEDWQGQFNSEEDFAYYIIDEYYDLPEFAKTYFDYEKYARDLFIGDYWFEDGHVFRNS
ncbi:MAG: antirestriction protein ArdA [Pseudosphingobacterium sp.]|nr:antirestriction protein ArdA [Pseudosphingobacterium sp.]